MIDPGENAEVPRGPASEVGKAGCWERVYSGSQQCEGKLRAGGQAGLQCSACFLVDHFYKILRFICVKFACFVTSACVGTSFVSLLDSSVVPFTCSIPILVNHFLFANNSIIDWWSY